MNAEVYETLPTSSVAIHMTAGAIAGIMEHCVMYPLDSVKVIALFLAHFFFSTLHNLNYHLTEFHFRRILIKLNDI